MLFPNRHQHYQEFKQLLQQSETVAKQDNVDRAAILAAFEEVQQFFTGKIMESESNGLDPPLSSLEQSYLTEMHKQLRLLAMDIKFWQASRMPATAEARKIAISDRIHTLIRYCNTLLQKAQNS
ncbi:hypothetical protein BCD67_24290 [Oscillatoriales cyanobacterium USR001]|nr:hypothetical protein BCD67_24290 [Oscillatoriales cyanobacterium USR001]